MPTALAEWTTERPDEPGFYWWRLDEGDSRPDPVYLYSIGPDWMWAVAGCEEPYPATDFPLSLWWPVRLDPPPVG